MWVASHSPKLSAQFPSCSPLSIAFHTVFTCQCLDLLIKGRLFVSTDVNWLVKMISYRGHCPTAIRKQLINLFVDRATNTIYCLVSNLHLKKIIGDRASSKIKIRKNHLLIDLAAVI